MTSKATTRRSTMAMAALAMVVLATAGPAWACSKNPSASAAGGQTSGPSGTKITVTGHDFDAGPVEVRWDSKTGTLLANASGPSFSVQITIPQAPAGVHHIISMQTVGGGTGTFAFEVTAPRSQTSNTDQGTTNEGETSTSAGAADEDETSTTGGGSTGTNTSTGGSNTGSSSGNDSTGTSTGSSTGSSTGTNTASTGTSGSTASPDSGSSVAAAPATAGAASAATPPRQAKPASANPPAVTAPTGQVVFGGSSSAPAEEVASISSATMVSGDTWSGFAATTKPSLLSDAVAPGSSSDSSNAPALAVGLLAAAMVAMFTGFGVAEMSRKRALAVAEKR